MATAKFITVAEFKPDTTTQVFRVLHDIAIRYQRMEDLLTECAHDERNRLCVETADKVSNLLGDLDESLL